MSEKVLGFYILIFFSRFLARIMFVDMLIVSEYVNVSVCIDQKIIFYVFKKVTVGFNIKFDMHILTSLCKLKCDCLLNIYI